MINYVAGFAFKNNFKEVLLIHKKRPEWQAGSFNGVGGKIELGESSKDAMSREFHEEVGVDVPPSDWNYFCTIHGADFDWRVSFFWTNHPHCYLAKMMEDEQPTWIQSNHLPPNIIDNLNWLIPMAMAKSQVMASVFEKKT